jgi:hypothetical protein
MEAKQENEKINAKIQQLKGHIKIYQALWMKTAKADGGAAFPIDMLSSAVTHRSMCLISGFCDMIEKRNFICAAPLIRLMLDNLLRFYTMWLVDEPHDLATEIMKGKEIRKIKDRNGNKMTDSYLVNQLSKEYQWLPNVYRETSGYIHLSSKHYFNTVNEVCEKDHSVKIALGPDDTSIPEEIREESLDAMIEISTAVMKYLYGWAYTKETKAIVTNYNKSHNIGD